MPGNCQVTVLEKKERWDDDEIIRLISELRRPIFSKGGLPNILLIPGGVERRGVEMALGDGDFTHRVAPADSPDLPWHLPPSHFMPAE